MGRKSKVDVDVKTQREDYSEVIKEYYKALKGSGSDYNLRIDLLEILSQALNMQYEYLQRYDKEKRRQEELKLVKEVIVTVLPVLESSLVTAPSELLERYYKMYDTYYAFASRKSFRHYLLYMEWDKQNKTFEPRLDILAPLVYYLNKMATSNEIRLIRASLPPSYGKSYLVTMWTAWVFGQEMKEAMIRLSFSDSLVKGFSRATMDLLKSERHRKVFPYFETIKDCLFTKETESEWKLYGSELNASFYAEPRDGQVTGKRGNVVIIDDILKGASEANSKDLHESLWTKYITDWSSRATDGNQKTIAIGTMWSPDDLLNKIENFEKEFQDIVDDPKFKHTRITEDGKCVFINLPALDDNDESTLPEVFSTDYFRRQREALDPFNWECTYQQNPISPSGLEFSWDKLDTYEELPRDEKGISLKNEYCWASLDPARKGKDFVSMPIFNVIDNKHYLIDCIFQKKGMDELYDTIVNKIIQHQITNFHVENNTDTSLKTLLEMKLKEKNYNLCVITEIYSSRNKEQRIKDMQGAVKRNVVFPAKRKFARNTEMGKFMGNLTAYSFDYPNKNDDSIDSVCLYVDKFIVKKLLSSKPKPVKRIF